MSKSASKSVSKSLKRWYRLPDSGTTTSARRYVDAWRAFSAPIERALKARRFGYDPGLALQPEAGGSTIDLDSHTAAFVHRAAVVLEAIASGDRGAVDRLAQTLPDPPGPGFDQVEKAAMLARWALGRRDATS